MVEEVKPQGITENPNLKYEGNPPADPPLVQRRPKTMEGYVAVTVDASEASIGSIWMIRWENISYPFASQAAARESIRMTYRDHLVAESYVHGAETVYEVALDGRIQDRVVVVEYRVNDQPIQLPGRRVTPAEF